jgi:hypothetical protein
MDNVKHKRDAVFEEQQVHDQIKNTLSALLSEIDQKDASNDKK